MIDYLTQTTLLRLLVTLALVLAPHLPRLPLWESLLIVTVMVWRGLMALRQWRLPPAWLRWLVTLAAFAGVYAEFRSISGLTAGTALLSVMAALKLIEMRARRDVMVTVILMYFILVTHFLFAQEIWTVAYLLCSTVAITALLMDCNHPVEALPLRPTLRLSGIMVAQALPLMLVLFVLFPRIPGPLWSLPTDTGSGRSGLSDKMTPGDISSLMESDEVAFRVRFLDRIPEPGERYWRGPVFDRFDGRGWQTSTRIAQPVVVETEGEPVRYETTLEPHGARWLFALDVPPPASLPAGSSLDDNDLLLAAKPVQQRYRYQGTAHTHYRLQPELTLRERSHFLHLPTAYNPRSLKLAAQWRTEGMDDVAVVTAALQMFRHENFSYTLHPPRLARDSIDDFLFNTRQGFCEHYSSSFTFLMRAAGIPARVVTGYQGGEKNDISDYYTVHQYDAHAWSEVWLPERGWIRVDPTAAVAPERVDHGLSAAMTLAAGLPNFLAAQRSGPRRALNMRLDWVNAKWNEWVLAYGPELQGEFLHNFGIEDWSDMILALTVAVTLMMSVVGLLLLRQFAPVKNPDLALKHWRRAGRRLARAGYLQAAQEGPQDFARRVMREQPALRQPMQRLLNAYLHLRYLEHADQAAIREVAAAAKALRP